ncbi:phosphoglycolate phosphatase [Sphingopyxis sp.]|uniref:phosphoglycolate phosphatase n=1 Tax=Sphingopyxis sp. TaxID=1908224 RepID=UPI003D80CB56
MAMRAPEIDTVVFDLDGTLVDTAPDLIHALNYSLQSIGRPAVDPMLVRSLAGHGARALLEAGLALSGDVPDELIARAIPVFLDHYAANICTHSAPYPGLEAALEDLRAAGFRLAICTNKPEGLANRLVESLGWADLFAAVIGGDSLPVRKPDPLPLLTAIARTDGTRAIFVGDSAVDIDTAKAAAMPSIAVGFGFSDVCASQLGADLHIDHFDRLAAAVRAIAAPGPLRAERVTPGPGRATAAA